MSFALYIITYIFVLFYRYTTPRALHSFPTRRSSDLAPLNTYMTHAACAMVRKLRSGAKLGLLYGQGGFVTKHHALVLSRQAPRGALAQDTSVQAAADRHRGAVPEFVTEANGKGSVESFTVIYGRKGEAEHG